MLENVLKGNVQSGLAKEVFDEAVKIKSKEGEEKGLKKGLKKGREEGREEGYKKLIQKMHQNGMSIQEIASILEMSESVIQRFLEDTK